MITTVRNLLDLAAEYAEVRAAEERATAEFGVLTGSAPRSLDQIATEFEVEFRKLTA